MAQTLERILQIDDNVTERMVVQAIFDNASDVTFKGCSGSEDALAVIPEFKPQLILLNLNMPESDGLEILQTIRKIAGFEETPCVFLTTVKKVVMIDDYERLGVIGVIHKPVKPKTLFSDVTSYWTAYSEKSG